MNNAMQCYIMLNRQIDRLKKREEKKTKGKSTEYKLVYRVIGYD